jgi:CoA:oxalate CoA-transferase
MSQLNYRAAAYLNGGVIPARQHAGAHSFYVPAQLFETSSGYLALFVTHDEFWRRLCTEIDRPQWATDPRYVTMNARFDNRVSLLEELSAVLKAASAAEWEKRLRPLGVPAGAVTQLADVLDGDFLRAREMVVSVEGGSGSPLQLLASPIRFDGARGRYRPPPRLHEHTDELLGPQRR